ncbi:Retrovirus-related Pol poly from transposon [Brachionus plicatilis]|uniref:Retrovirus-related Pol poly from transposon n=1 Tax=Brachionus plicatilis TaxID=10195 RepID=A0A3M7RQS0_BRAPC|nr:Retrovirus-related Pol poly from transposon [Brachionus plicatilis]
MAKTGGSKSVSKFIQNKSSAKDTPSSYNKVNNVKQEDYTVNVEEYAVFMRLKQGKSNQGYELNMVKLEYIHNDGPRTKVNVDDVQIDLLVDTGTPVNIFDEETFVEFKSSVILTKMDFGKSSAEERIVVIKGKSECLFSNRTAVKLIIIKMVNKVKAMGYQELKAKFPKLFSDAMGLNHWSCDYFRSGSKIRILRWALRSEDFEYEVVVQKPGLSNEADFFSRQPTGKIGVEHVQESNFSEAYVALVVQSAVPEAITLREILCETKRDTDVDILAEIVRNGTQADLLSSLNDFKKELKLGAENK